MCLPPAAGDLSSSVIIVGSQMNVELVWLILGVLTRVRSEPALLHVPFIC